MHVNVVELRRLLLLLPSLFAVVLLCTKTPRENNETRIQCTGKRASDRNGLGCDSTQIASKSFVLICNQLEL